MDSKLILRVAMLVIGLVFVSGCAKVSEPWDKTGYFKEERSRSAEQQERLQHRLAHFREAPTRSIERAILGNATSPGCRPEDGASAYGDKEVANGEQALI
jgi:hypothetical protein